MKIFYKRSLSDRYNLFLFGFNVYYKRIEKDCIKKRFLCFRWTKKNQSENIIKETNRAIRYYGKPTNKKRLPVDQIFDLIKDYDVISFDIFDTALRRTVVDPKHIFDLVGIELQNNDFKGIRTESEKELRSINLKKHGSREVTLSEIYDLICSRYNLPQRSKELEITIEEEMIEQDKYIKKIYDYAKKLNKIIVFTSDMYLESDIIEKFLLKKGYEYFDNVIVSNKYRATKGDGTLYEILKERYANKKIIHLGDNERSDYIKAKEHGIAAICIPKADIFYKEDNLDGLSGSFYRSLIGNKLYSGLDNNLNLQYEHGYRIGGILCMGYLQYINRLIVRNKIDKILFCSRDCDILYKVYTKLFNNKNAEYIQISRYAILNCMSERYVHDIINRFIIKYIREFKNKLPIFKILEMCGYAYLNDQLDKNDIDPYKFPVAIAERHILDFLYSQRDVIVEHNKSSMIAATSYFKQLIGNAQNILIVDIGWSGTCITALKALIQEKISSKINVYGSLMCSSRNETLKESIHIGEIDSYIYSPYKNLDLARFMMPAKVDKKKENLLHMPLEYMFTSTDKSLLSYSQNKDGTIVFNRMNNSPINYTDIKNIQKGIFDFCLDYFCTYRKYISNIHISPYVAFMPLKTAIEHDFYTYSIYKNFLYDPVTIPFNSYDNNQNKFGDLFNYYDNAKQFFLNTKKVLLVSPEMIYTGAPKSLLRIGKILKELGYDCEVWTMNDGPFSVNFKNHGIPVSTVNVSSLKDRDVVNKIKQFSFAICNTILTYKFVQVCEQYIKTVWYIREATNIPDFIKNNKELVDFLKSNKNIFCVSEYAANAIANFTNQDIHVLENSVEDERNLVKNNKLFNKNKLNLIQLGTIEYRKGYDVLIEAVLTLPENIRNNVELYFAGGFINSGTPFSSYIFNKIRKRKNIHYLGVISNNIEKLNNIASSDVVVVASRDESCSLVALEGAMLSKPLIVTDKVGANYMVNKKNGLIVKAGDVDSLRKAIVDFYNKKEKLNDMGLYSRYMYEKRASISSYKENIKKLLESDNFNDFKVNISKKTHSKIIAKTAKCIVSLTSYQKRINSVHLTIESLLQNSYKDFKVILYLSLDNFPKGLDDLPVNLKALIKNNKFEIKFVKDDLKPHKKYFYAFKEYADYPVIIVDDDIIYDNRLIEVLMNSYMKFPNCISCTRANYMAYNDNKKLRAYWSWPMNYKSLINTPSYRLLPTGCGGVLYPPKLMPESTFDINAIKKSCIVGDDLWLKFNSLISSIKVVIPDVDIKNETIPGSQDSALGNLNVDHYNDVMIKNITLCLQQKGVSVDNLLTLAYKDMFC